MAKKATHKGMCQACGRYQMLPGGVLSKHGYTVEYGFFNGICRGAGYLPFEQSHDQVDRYIAEAEAERGRLLAFAAELRTPATEGTEVYHRIYEKASALNRWRGRYVERIGRVISSQRTSASGYTWNDFYFLYTDEAKNERREYVQTALRYYLHGRTNGKQVTALDVATELNAKKAERVERSAEILNRYIKWQQYRVATWKEMPLYSVEKKTKDTAAFNPEEAE